MGDDFILYSVIFVKSSDDLEKIRSCVFEGGMKSFGFHGFDNSYYKYKKDERIINYALNKLYTDDSWQAATANELGLE